MRCNPRYPRGVGDLIGDAYVVKSIDDGWMQLERVVGQQQSQMQAPTISAMPALQPPTEKAA